MNILLIDNYDSFTYSLYQMIGAITSDITVIRNNELSVPEIMRLEPRKIVLSPGPGRPENAGVTLEVVKKLGRKVPVLGVCLGHQAICQAFGAKITPAEHIAHGQTSLVKLDTNCLLFKGLPDITTVASYHALTVPAKEIPWSLYVTARTAENEVMAVKHRAYRIYGVQFHPESILTPDGEKMLRNFVAI